MVIAWPGQQPQPLDTQEINDCDSFEILLAEEELTGQAGSSGLVLLSLSSSHDDASVKKSKDKNTPSRTVLLSLSLSTSTDDGLMVENPTNHVDDARPKVSANEKENVLSRHERSVNRNRQNSYDVDGNDMPGDNIGCTGCSVFESLPKKITSWLGQTVKVDDAERDSHISVVTEEPLLESQRGLSNNSKFHQEYNLAVQQERNGEIKEAIQSNEKLLELLFGDNFNNDSLKFADNHFENKKLSKPAHVLLDGAETYSRLGVLHEKIEEYDIAVKNFSEALNMYTHVKTQNETPDSEMKNEEDVFDLHENIAITLNHLGQAHSSLGERKKAMQAYHKALGILLDLGDGYHNSAPNIMYNLAALNASGGEYNTALKLYKNVLEIQRLSFGGDHLDVSATLECIGAVYEKKEYNHRHLAKQGRRNVDYGAHALKNYVEALNIRGTVLGENHPLVAMTLFCIGKFHYRRWKIQRENMAKRIYAKEATLYFEEAMNCYQANGVCNDHPNVTKIESYLGKIAVSY